MKKNRQEQLFKFRKPFLTIKMYVTFPREQF